MTKEVKGRKHEVQASSPLAPAPIAPGKRTRTQEGDQGSSSASDRNGEGDERRTTKGSASQRAGDWVMDDESLAALGLSPRESSTAGDEDPSVCAPEQGTTSRAIGGRASPDINRNVSTGREGSLSLGTIADLIAPKAGVHRTGFIDHSDGSFLRAGPAEAGAPLLRARPLAPATRVFVSGVHPDTPEWWYVTAFLPGEIARGYVQNLRIVTDLPEPTAKLHQVENGDTVEKLAVREFSTAVRDGHDLRYYENVLLKVNHDRGRGGIRGSYQDPGVLGGGANNIQLVAGHRIWLVSPAYARSLEGVVPDGSLTNGGVAKVKRFAGHLEDLLASITRSPAYLGEVAGEFAQAIHDHLAEVIGITGAFLVAESVSIAAAASPTGVGQLLAFLIQTLLAILGAAGMVEAASSALTHGSLWMQLAWGANGADAKIAAASREFLRMLIALAMAALAYTGAKASAGKAASILSNGGAMPALAIAGSRSVVSPAGGQAAASVGALPGPSSPASSIGVSGAMMSKHEPASRGSPSTSTEKTSSSGKGSAATSAKDAAEQAGKDHVHIGGIVTEIQSPYFGKWDGSGIHDWDGLVAMCRRDGFTIKRVTEDPVTGIRRVAVERTGVHPKTGAPVKGVIEKTIYPKRLTPAQIDAAGESAFDSALRREPGTKLDLFGSKLRRDGSPADGYFEAVVKAGDPPRSIRIQGWYKENSAGERTITSHTPAFEKDWPEVDPGAH
jgi:hypothetical protein